jgi:hypothetical protein
MQSFNLQSTVNNKNLIDYSLFKVLDSVATSTQIPLSQLEASDKLINLKLRTTEWLGYEKNSMIGYKSKTGLGGSGITEQDAYIVWIEDFKDKEKRFKKLFPLTSLTQSQYDSMLGLYTDTGSFRFVGTENRKFELQQFIIDGKWDHVATALTISGANRLSRQAEAKILMLGDYGATKSRTLIKQQGIQTLVKEYSNKQLSDLQSNQAEYVYYAETKRFLPNMTESRKQLLVKQLS